MLDDATYAPLDAYRKAGAFGLLLKTTPAGVGMDFHDLVVSALGNVEGVDAAYFERLAEVDKQRDGARRYIGTCHWPRLRSRAPPIAREGPFRASEACHRPAHTERCPLPFGRGRQGRIAASRVRLWKRSTPVA